MKLRCDIILPDNCDYHTKFDAIAKASRDESMWHEVKSREELKKLTSLDNKCGSCKYFVQIENSARGTCKAGRVWGERTRPKCKKYEKEKG